MNLFARKTGFFVLLLVVLAAGIYWYYLAASRVSLLYTGQMTAQLLHAKPMEMDIYRSGVKWADFGEVFSRARQIRESRLKGKNQCLLVDTGGSLVGPDGMNIFFKGKPMAELMGALSYDAVVPSWDERQKGENLPLLASNFSSKDSPARVNSIPYRLFHLKGRILLVLGYIASPALSAPSGEELLAGAESLRKLIVELKPDYTVLISSTSQGELLAASIPETDLVLAGKPPLGRDPREPFRAGKTWIAPWLDSHVSIGEVQFVFYPFFHRPQVRFILHGYGAPTPSESPEYERIFEKYYRSFNDTFQGRFEKVAGDFLALGESFLSHHRLIFRESPLGDLIADILREKTGADLALINHRAIRKGLRKIVVFDDLREVLPFGNEVCMVFLSGGQIEDLLRRNALENRRYLQVSGAEVAYQPGHENSAIVHIQGEPIRKDRFYSVATIDYLAGGARGKEPVFLRAQKKAYTGILLNHLIYNDFSRRQWLNRPSERVVRCGQRPALALLKLRRAALEAWRRGERERAIEEWKRCALIMGNQFSIPSSVELGLSEEERGQVTGDILSRAGLWRTALREYGRIGSEKAVCAASEMSLGQLFHRLGRWELSSEMFHRFLSRKKVSSQMRKKAFWFLGLAEIALFRYDRAERAFEKSTPSSDVLFMKGWSQFMQGKLREARKSLSQAISEPGERRLKNIARDLNLFSGN